MSDEPDLRGADGPRAIPADARRRIEAALLEGSTAPASDQEAVPADASLLAGADAPRPLPPSLRSRLTASMTTAPPPRRWYRVVAAAAVIILVASVIAGAASDRGPTGPESAAHHAGAGHLLAPFASCDELLRYYHDNATAWAATGAYGFGGGPMTLAGRVMSPFLAADGAVPTGATAAGATTRTAAPAPGDNVSSVVSAVSTSNVQEEGVDEPDSTKTDGAHLYVATGGRLEVVDITGAEPAVVATMTLDPSARLLLVDHHLLALTTEWTGPPGSTTTVTSIDVSDPTHPAVAGTAVIDGNQVAARLVGGAVQLVVDRPPQVTTYGPDGMPLDPASVIAASTIQQWIGDRPCTSVQHPTDFAGFDLLSIYTIDPAAPSAATSTSLVAGGATVYASGTDIYVAEQSWPLTPPGALDTMSGDTMSGDATSSGSVVALAPATTDIHQFAFDELGATYVASGTVEGHLLDQFSMSQAEGRLRVATSTGFGVANGGSGVTVLEAQGDALVRVGEIAGLAPGEEITGVRFVGTKAYLVTAVQMHDPLFVIDLSDPTNPVLLGQVELPGFSSYVHPLDDGHLLAVGPDATGTMAAKLFDVSDPTAPVLVDTINVEHVNALVQMGDHLSFLYWPATGLVVVPYLDYQSSEGSPTGWAIDALALHFDGTSLREQATITHFDRPGIAYPLPFGTMAPGLWRSVVVDDRLFTVSDAGVLASDLATLADLAWTPYPAG